jgi:hypothetical protein
MTLAGIPNPPATTAAPAANGITPYLLEISIASVKASREKPSTG